MRFPASLCGGHERLSPGVAARAPCKSNLLGTSNAGWRRTSQRRHMRSTRITIGIAVLVTLGAVAAAIAQSQLPMIGASALLYPTRRPPTRPVPPNCVERSFDGVGVRLSGWVCTADAATNKPTIVYLHGVADNRDSSVGIIDRFRQRGFNVIAYDSRRHGGSEG